MANVQYGTSGKEQTAKRGSTWVRWAAIMGFVAGIVCAQQVVADNVGYAEELGARFGKWYFPGVYFRWVYDWWETDLKECLRDGAVAGSFVSGVIFLAITAAQGVIGKKDVGTSDLHGSAHFASIKEIEKMGILDNQQGVFIGAWWGKRHWWQTHEKLYYLRDNSAFHVLCCAPTRSGKGVALVLPTLLTWGESALISDLKGELWDLTSGWRSRPLEKGGGGNYCIRFEPGQKDSAHWNVLDEIDMTNDLASSQIEDIAMIVMDHKGEGLKDHWDLTGYAFLCGIMRYLILERERGHRKASMSEIYYLIGDPKRPIKPLLEAMAKDPDQMVKTCGQQMLDKPEQERGSVISTAVSRLEVYNDKIVAENTNDSHFLVKDIMNKDKPVSLYLITTPDNKERLKPLLRVFVSMYLKKCTGRDGLKNENGRQTMAHAHKCLLMLDEFPSFGQLQDLADGLAFIAGYGMKAFLITQDLSQLYKIYSKEEAITSNCHIQSWFQPLKLETAEYISKALGECTVVKTRLDISGKRGSIFGDSVSKRLEEVKRSLLTPEEVAHLPGPKMNGRDLVEPGDMLITIQGRPPIYGKQPLYFKDPILSKRSKISPLSPEFYVNLRQKTLAANVKVDISNGNDAQRP